MVMSEACELQGSGVYVCAPVCPCACVPVCPCACVCACACMCACAHVCAHMCACVCACAHMCVHVCMYFLLWKPEVDVLSSTLVLRLSFEARSLANPKACRISWTGWPASLRDPPVSTSPVLGLQEYADMSGCWDLNLGSHACRKKMVYPLSHLHNPQACSFK